MPDPEIEAAFDLPSVEAEICRLPEIVACRIVADSLSRPVEVHVLARMGKHPKQVVRDIQSVALASFGLEFDRRIVSVVQLANNGSDPASEAPSAVARPAISSVQSHAQGTRVAMRVSLALGEHEVTGFAEGSAASGARPRLVASAALDALCQLESAAVGFDLEAVELVRIGSQDVVIVSLVWIDPPMEQRLVGSALVLQSPETAAARAVLDATNRRLAFLTERKPR